MILARWFRPNQSMPLYKAIVATARRPWAYRDAAVPDTVDGRFDFLLLHLCLVMERLNQETPDFNQALIDYFCTDMDDNLRELGVGDLSVAKKVRTMAEALAGRFIAYQSASTHGIMLETIRRNIYAGRAEPGAAQVATYALGARKLLATQTVAEIRAGNPHFT